MLRASLVHPSCTLGVYGKGVIDLMGVLSPDFHFYQVGSAWGLANGILILTQQGR